MSGVFVKVLSYRRGKRHAKVGIYVYLAYRHACGFSEHILGNAFCAGHRAAVRLYYLHVFGQNAARAVENNGELGKAFGNLFEDIETKAGVAFEFERAVACPDCNGEAVHARFAYEFFNLVGVGVASVSVGYVYVVFNAGESAELGRARI